MKHIVAIILLGVFSQQVFSFSEVQEKGYLRIAVYKGYAPFSFREKGKLIGIEVELGKLLAAKLGVDPLIWAISADETMSDDLRNSVWKGHYIGGGTADVMLHVPVNKNFAEENDKVVISNAYFKEEIVAVRHNSRASIPLLNLFSSENIGVELDTLADFYLVGANSGRFRENVKHYTTIEDAVKALSNGDVRSVVGPRSQLEAALKSTTAEYLFTKVSMPLSYQSQWNVGMAVKRGRDELVEKLTVAFEELKKTGELSALFEKYGITYIAP
ncbi:MAG: hypothetical protein A6F70_05230 [Cycloclasticus sp. symbiont of Bathymodiolus heckerae]|nr:MAG: hypothetical protein A6F70_05230 [Cycloclasticus sp. symbiont of Bathymodiolus heckerae]